MTELSILLRNFTSIRNISDRSAGNCHKCGIAKSGSPMPSQEISSSNRTMMPEEGRRLARSLNACGQESRVTLGALVCAARLSANDSSCSRRPICSRGGSPSNERKWSASAAHSRMNVLLPIRRLPWQTISEAPLGHLNGKCHIRCQNGRMSFGHLTYQTKFRCQNQYGPPTRQGAPIREFRRHVTSRMNAPDRLGPERDEFWRGVVFPLSHACSCSCMRTADLRR